MVRTSTKQQTEVTNISASMAKKRKRKNAKRVVRVYTQEELLKEVTSLGKETSVGLKTLPKTGGQDRTAQYNAVAQDQGLSED